MTANSSGLKMQMLLPFDKNLTRFLSSKKEDDCVSDPNLLFRKSSIKSETSVSQRSRFSRRDSQDSAEFKSIPSSPETGASRTSRGGGGSSAPTPNRVSSPELVLQVSSFRLSKKPVSKLARFGLITVSSATTSTLVADADVVPHY